MTGVMIPEIDVVGDNANIQREPLRLMHMPNPYVIAESETSVSVTNGEGTSTPMTCQAADASDPLQQPALDICDRCPDS